jgi:electron transfer flavoprotein alpha subunit
MCGACVSQCPVKALQLPEKSAASTDLSAYKGVWVYAEILDGAPRSVSLELLSKGRALAVELGEELCAVVIGDSNSKYFDALSSYGASKIYNVEAAGYKDYNTEAYANALARLINKYKPSVVLYPSTYQGRDLSPRIAAEIITGLTADCTGLSIKNGNLVQTRPAFGGNIMADIITPNHRPQMATVRPNVMTKELLAVARAPRIVNESVPLPANAARVRIISQERDKNRELDKLDEARIILSGGRGMKTAENFKVLNEIASLLGGAVGASRAAVDAGWEPKSRQVGQSGVTVKPKLYLACGISGAVQHIVGMQGSDIIIAVNKDDSAPIFNIAKYAIVGDANAIMPKVFEALKASEKS